MANINTIPEKMESVNTRPMMIKSAAKALAQLPLEDVVGIASSSTALFVQTTRKTFRANGFNFTDTDLREIHEELRRLASDLINRGGLGLTTQ